MQLSTRIHLFSNRRLASGLLLLIVLAIAATGARADEKKTIDAKNILKGKAAEDLAVLKLEVDVLEKLYHLELNAEQLAAFLKLAQSSAAKMPVVREAQAGAEYGKILKDLHAALLEEDEERIRGSSEKLDELHEKETIVLDDEFEMTDAALKAAPHALKLLSAAQAAAYLAALDDEVPDPIERILSALEEGEELNADEWKELRDATATEAGWLLAGFHDANSAPVVKRVTAFLDSGHQLKGEKLKQAWPNLKKSAHQLAGNVGPLVVLQHYLERELAELLSNPRTASALRLWIKQMKE